MIRHRDEEADDGEGSGTAADRPAAARRGSSWRRRFAAAALWGYNEGIDNHFSCAVPGRDDLFLLNPYGPDWSELTASDMLAIDQEGVVVDGDGDWEIRRS